MLKESAMVMSVSPGKARVSLVRSEACGDCAAKSMCHSSPGGTMVMEVRNPIQARPGEKVVITLPPKELVKASAMVYLLPATAMVAGATVGWLKTGTDMGAMIGTLGGILVSSLYLFLHGRRKKEISGPVISEVQGPGSGVHA